VDTVDSGHDVADFLEGESGGELLGLEQVIFGDVEVVLGGVLRRAVVAVVFVVGKGLLRKDARKSQRLVATH
jgi:hypothetical protein